MEEAGDLDGEALFLGIGKRILRPKRISSIAR
jgi:hypothetical protein